MQNLFPYSSCTLSITQEDDEDRTGDTQKQLNFTSCADVEDVWISNITQRDANNSSSNFERLIFSWNPDPETERSGYTVVIGQNDDGRFDETHRLKNAVSHIGHGQMRT